MCPCIPWTVQVNHWNSDKKVGFPFTQTEIQATENLFWFSFNPKETMRPPRLSLKQPLFQSESQDNHMTLFIWHQGVFDSKNQPMCLIKAEGQLLKAQAMQILAKH